MLREKKRASSFRRDKPTSAEIEKNSISDGRVDENYQIARLCECLSLRSVFRSKRRYRQHVSSCHEEDIGYESTLSKSSVTTPTIDHSFSDSPKVRHDKSPPKISGGNDEISCQSSASKSNRTISTSNNSFFDDIPKIQHDKSPSKISGFNDEISYECAKFKSNASKSSRTTLTSDNSLLDIPTIQLDMRPSKMSGVSGERSCERADYKSSASESSRTTHITDASFFDPVPISDGSSCESVDVSSLLDLTPLVNKVSNITLAESAASKVDMHLSLDGLFITKEKISKSDYRNVIDPHDVQRVGRRYSGCFSLPDESAETALIERQLDEMSNQSSILSFDADDFLEDDNDDGNYVVHVESCLDLSPIDEEIAEDSE